MLGSGIACTFIPLAALLSFAPKADTIGVEKNIVFNESCPGSSDIFGTTAESISSSTQQSPSLRQPFYDCIANEAMAFLSDEEDLDYSRFEKSVNELHRYGELNRFCSYLLLTRADNELALWIRGILEIDADIYSDDWFKRFLDAIVEMRDRNAPLRHLAEVVAREYY